MRPPKIREALSLYSRSLVAGAGGVEGDGRLSVTVRLEDGHHLGA